MTAVTRSKNNFTELAKVPLIRPLAHDNHGTSYAQNSCFPLALCFDCRGLYAGLFYLQIFENIPKRGISQCLSM